MVVNMQKKRVLIYTADDKVTPLDVDWDEKKDVPDNIMAHVKPFVPSEHQDGQEHFVVGVGRGYVWTGHSNLFYDGNAEFCRAVRTTESDNTLWEKPV